MSQEVRRGLDPVRERGALSLHPRKQTMRLAVRRQQANTTLVCHLGCVAVARADLQYRNSIPGNERAIILG